MDNHLLTSPETSNGAGFNRLPFYEADFKVNEINDLGFRKKQVKNNSWLLLVAVHKIVIVHNSLFAVVIRRSESA